MGECWKSWLGQSMAVMSLTMPSRVRWRDKQGMALPLSSIWSGALSTWVLFLDLAHRSEASSHSSTVSRGQLAPMECLPCVPHMSLGWPRLSNCGQGRIQRGEDSCRLRLPLLSYASCPGGCFSL